MSLKENQPSLGTQKKDSPPDEVSRTGRDSYLHESGTRSNKNMGKDGPEGARTGRPSAFGPNPAQSAGVRPGADNDKGDPTGRIPDGVGKPLPSP